MGPGVTCVVSVPLLLDKVNGKIVSNDSGDIMEMFNFAFNEITGNNEDYLKPKFVFGKNSNKDFNNFCVGVYKTALAKDEKTWESAFQSFFEDCDELDRHLEKTKFLSGDSLSICDLKIFSTLIRFDVAYYFLYHANLKGISKTVEFDQIKKLYYGNQAQNPGGRVPIGH